MQSHELVTEPGSDANIVVFYDTQQNVPKRDVRMVSSVPKVVDESKKNETLNRF